MTSHRRPYARPPLIAAAVAVVLGLGVIPASAQPADPPTSGSQDPMQRYQELGAQAAKADEDMLTAQEQQKAREAERKQADAALTKANEEVSKAQAAIETFRTDVNKIAEAAFVGQQLTGASVLLDSGSRQEFLDRSAALALIAGQKEEALSGLRDAMGKAEAARAGAADAQGRAKIAADGSTAAVEEVRKRKSDLDKQIKEVRKALGQLPSADRQKLGQVQDSGSYLGPPGAANDALQAALSKRGSQYKWGATGPNTFDCSGLTSWAYKQAGVSLPRTSRQQYTAGKPVSLSQLMPGDLLFYDDGTGNPAAIHHVAIYVGEGKMVDAPTEGQVVDVRSSKGDGHLMGARRIVG
ncbi:NlpC/P60 family protein [Amycolatopsis roodepoortensis]|uniref:C40 family peptidase n=1 Tax=Amycolatopsis roodepoortensis TaxID=700274 RepID=UPI00214C1A6D|nr:C40 family peptidase [Amycolatopsis roodepoortensis]UUV35869.1 NlpC/P60 family protein [Amycolatopsis roodepoortensis]